MTDKIDLETPTKEIPTLVRGKNNYEIYLVGENDLYSNLSNGKCGRIKPEDAAKYFVIPLRLNDFAMKNPVIVEMIQKLNLRIEP